MFLMSLVVCCKNYCTTLTQELTKDLVKLSDKIESMGTQGTCGKLRLRSLI